MATLTSSLLEKIQFAHNHESLSEIDDTSVNDGVSDCIRHDVHAYTLTCVQSKTEWEELLDVVDNVILHVSMIYPNDIIAIVCQGIAANLATLQTISKYLNQVRHGSVWYECEEAAMFAKSGMHSGSSSFHIEIVHIHPPNRTII